MGWDLVSFLEGPKNTSLVHAIKGSSEYVYGEAFTRHLRINRYATRFVIHEEAALREADRWQAGPDPASLPTIESTAISALRYRSSLDKPAKDPVFGGCLREIAPRLDDDMVRRLGIHLLMHCEPHDAIEIRDYRKLPPQILARG